MVYFNSFKTKTSGYFDGDKNNTMLYVDVCTCHSKFYLPIYSSPSGLPLVSLVVDGPFPSSSYLAASPRRPG